MTDWNTYSYLWCFVGFVGDLHSRFLLRLQEKTQFLGTYINQGLKSLYEMFKNKSDCGIG